MQEKWVWSLGWEDSPGEGNGNPLQYSCLENPMDGEAWWATVHGVTESRTRLSDFTFMDTKCQHCLARWQVLGYDVVHNPLRYSKKCLENSGKTSQQSQHLKSIFLFHALWWTEWDGSPQWQAYIRIYTIDSFCHTVETNTTLYSNYPPIKIN